MSSDLSPQVFFFKTMTVLASETGDGETSELVIQRAEIPVPTEKLLRVSVARILNAQDHTRRIGDQVEIAAVDASGEILGNKVGSINGSEVMQLDIASASKQRDVVAVVKILRRSSAGETMFFTVGDEEQPRISCRAELLSSLPAAASIDGVTGGLPASEAAPAPPTTKPDGA